MSLYGPTFHATSLDLCIKFQCKIYICLVPCLVEINFYYLYNSEQVHGCPHPLFSLFSCPDCAREPRECHSERVHGCSHPLPIRCQPPAADLRPVVSYQHTISEQLRHELSKSNEHFNVASLICIIDLSI